MAAPEFGHNHSKEWGWDDANQTWRPISVDDEGNIVFGTIGSVNIDKIRVRDAADTNKMLTVNADGSVNIDSVTNLDIALTALRDALTGDPAGTIEALRLLLVSINSNTDGLEGFSDGVEALLTTIRDNADNVETLLTSLGTYTDGIEALLTTIKDNADTLEASFTDLNAKDFSTSAKQNPLDRYRIADIAKATVAYYGFTTTTGVWYILREDKTVAATPTYRYANLSNNGTINGGAASAYGFSPTTNEPWTNRATLTYDYLHNLTGV